MARKPLKQAALAGSECHKRRRGDSGFEALIAPLWVSAHVGLRTCVRCEHAEADRLSGGELHVHNAARAFTRNVIKVRRFAADHDAKRDARVEAALECELGRKRNFEAAGDVKADDLGGLQAAGNQRAPCAIFELPRKIFIEACDDQRNTPSTNLRKSCCSTIVDFHARSKCPIFSRFVFR